MLEQRILELKVIIAENDGRNAADARFARAVDELVSSFYDGVSRLSDLPSRALFDLFLWPSGQFEFREGEFPTDILITFESPVTPVIMEGIRRVDEWQRIKSVFPSMETTVKVKGPPPPGADATEKALLALAASGKSLAEISLELRRSEFETASLVYEMHGRGVVVVGEVRPESQAPDPVGAIQALLTLTRMDSATGYGYLLLSAIGIALSTLINFVGVKFLAFAKVEPRAERSDRDRPARDRGERPQRSRTRARTRTRGGEKVEAKAPSGESADTPEGSSASRNRRRRRRRSGSGGQAAASS